MKNPIPEVDALMWQFGFNMEELSRAVQRMYEAINDGDPALERAMAVFEDYERDERERRSVDG